MSKEIQLSLSFCGALAALLLISAPVNETASLIGSGSAFLVAGGFFYGGISKYFSDKIKQLAEAEQRSELLRETFTTQLAQRDEKFIVQIKDIIATIDSRFNDVIDAVENLEDSLKPLGSMSETLTTINDIIKKINVAVSAIEDNSSKLNDLHKATKDVSDNLEEVAENVEKISLVREGLQELASALYRQEEFYKTALNQYKNMSGKDFELIENLARKLR